MKKTLKTVLWVLAAFMLADLLYRALLWRPDELTVTARFRIPMYKHVEKYYSSLPYHGFGTFHVFPGEAVEIAQGAHDAPYRPGRMHRGSLRTGFSYGPDAVRGVIRREDILKVWPEAPLEEDWPFHISFYNTSTGRPLRMYLDISYDAEWDRAEAVLYVFCPGLARPETVYWQGNPGEPIRVFIEI